MSEEWQYVSTRSSRRRQQQQIKPCSNQKRGHNHNKLPVHAISRSPRAAINEIHQIGLDLIGNRSIDESIPELRSVKTKHLMKVDEKSVKLSELGKTETALDLLDKALAVDGNFVPALLTKLSILNDLGRHEHCHDILIQLGESHYGAKFTGSNAITFVLLLDWLLDCLDDQCVSKLMTSVFKFKLLTQVGRYYGASLQELGPLSEVFPMLVCTENKEDFSVVENLLSKHFPNPVETPVAFQLRYYAYFVRGARPQIPVGLGELIAQYAKEWSVSDLKMGDLVDVQDKGAWYESEILQLSEDAIRVHYTSFSSLWDEWVPRRSERIAALHTFTSNGPNW
eukprot:TRINITY_DN7570_c0_g1_i1.p1 TRINITY_DN7570_c0_g1~~TRINITY_DN7570_c0_g1_i1.p1  ORF type:complete len:339 (-),score=64.24 TRINITY_DN7570_c0_g1_i1:61-1077(-)